MKTKNAGPRPPDDVSSPPETTPGPHSQDGQETACTQPECGDDATPKKPEALPKAPNPSDAVNREAKIAELKRAVESGSYDVTAEQLAERLLREILRDLPS